MPAKNIERAARRVANRLLYANRSADAETYRLRDHYPSDVHELLLATGDAPNLDEIRDFEKAVRRFLREGGLGGICDLRAAVKLFDGCRESFNERFSADELLTLRRARLLSGHSFLPDEWTETQINQALRGIVPSWDDEENPVYGHEPSFEP